MKDDETFICFIKMPKKNITCIYNETVYVCRRKLLLLTVNYPSMLHFVHRGEANRNQPHRQGPRHFERGESPGDKLS